MCMSTYDLIDPFVNIHIDRLTTDHVTRDCVDSVTPHVPVAPLDHVLAPLEVTQMMHQL